VRGTGNDVSVAVLDEAPPEWVRRLRRTCLRLLEASGVAEAEVSVLLTGDLRMRELKRRYRRVDRTTDVLSFSQDEPGVSPLKAALGDIVISLPALRRNARRYGVPADQELERLVAHGLLHLLGWDHRTVADRARMATRQEALVRGLRA